MKLVFKTGIVPQVYDSNSLNRNIDSHSSTICSPMQNVVALIANQINVQSIIATIYISLSTIVLNSRDQQGMYGI